jgi:hypothetical protein
MKKSNLVLFTILSFILLSSILTCIFLIPSDSQLPGSYVSERGYSIPYYYSIFANILGLYLLAINIVNLILIIAEIKSKK